MRFGSFNHSLLSTNCLDTIPIWFQIGQAERPTRLITGEAARKRNSDSSLPLIFRQREGCIQYEYWKFERNSYVMN